MLPSAAYIVIICSFLIRVSIIGSDFLVYHTAGSDKILYNSVGQAIAYLLYPLLGWLSDVYFTRYKVIRLAFIIVTVAAAIATVAAIILVVLYVPYRNLGVVMATILALIIALLGLGLFEANAIQFGMDQMLEASSDQLSTFIHWYYWSINLGHVLPYYITLGVLVYYSSCKIDFTDLGDELFYNIYSHIILCMAVVLLTLSFTGLCLLIRTRKHLSIERPGQNPLKLIHQVLKYAWNHTCPENRSAFTYWEEDIPPRIDLGKNKYGGPFTTEEVEDTKSFLRILFLLCSLLGFHLSGNGYSLSNQLMKRDCPSFWVLMMLGDPMHLTTLTIIIGVPFYKLFTVCCCQKYLPNMLKRMGLGLLCCLLKATIEIILQATQTNSQWQCHHIYHTSFLVSCYTFASQLNINGTCSNITALTHHEYYCIENNTTFFLLIIPHVLQGLAYLLVFMTTLEFICAQAPLQLKGLLVGLWYASLAVHYLLVEPPEIYITDNTSWEIFHEVKAFLIAMSLFIYLYVSKHYHYRVRDEVVNEQFLVEEIYEREIQLAEEYEREKRAEMRALFGDPVSRPCQYGTIKEDQESSQSE